MGSTNHVFTSTAVAAAVSLISITLVLLITILPPPATCTDIDTVYEGKPCTLHYNCSIDQTQLLCISFDGGATHSCRCQYFRPLPEAPRVITFYNTEIKRCVIKKGDPCKHKTEQGRLRLISRCEPGTTCDGTTEEVIYELNENDWKCKADNGGANHNYSAFGGMVFVLLVSLATSFSAMVH